MASITIHNSQQSSNLFSHSNRPNNITPSSLSISSQNFDVSKWKQWRVCSAPPSSFTSRSEPASSKRIIPIHKSSEDRNQNKNDTVVYEKLDKWMENSVVEIVKNLKEAPLLVHVYDGEETTLRTEKCVAEESWGVMKEKWGRKETPMPEGVIFVEQLGKEEDDEHASTSNKEEGITRAWGVVVQGKGVECEPVCYLLKTSRVGSGGLSGVCCTHYCLMRVQSFGETALSQLKNCWLIQGGN